MKYDAKTRLLVSEVGPHWMKRLSCPLNKKWHQLQRLGLERHDDFTFLVSESSGDHTELKRHCPSCAKDVVDIDLFDDREVGALLRIDPSLCVHASRKSKHITFEGIETNEGPHGSSYSCSENTVGALVVNTARTIHAINAAAKEGFWPLLKRVAPSARIKEKILVSQNDDGTVDVGGDFRAAPGAETYWYNPYHSPLPFAAYLIPPGLRAGERVYLPDLIEDIEGTSWNQGDRYRLKSAYAVWDGKDLAVEHDEPRSFVG